MAKVIALKTTKATKTVETVLAGDVRSHLDRVLTMLDEVQSLIAAKDARSAALAYGLCSGAREELAQFSEHLC
jgi:hypothetical protein